MTTRTERTIQTSTLGDGSNDTMKKRIFTWAGVFAVALVAGFAATAIAQHVGIASSPRDIYFEPAVSPIRSPQERVAVRFWVELHPRDGETSKIVTADHVFHNRDRTRFRVAANVDCYVYIVYHGSSGNRALLFPSVQAGRDNRVRRYDPKTLPTRRGYFTFDDNPGQEHVAVVLSLDPVAEIERIVQARVGARPTTTSIRLSPRENRIWSDLQKQWTGKATGASTKNICSETETAGPQVGSYYAQPAAFVKPVVINITLKHER